MDKALRMVQFTQAINPATALMVDAILFVCEQGAAYEIVEAVEAHTVAGSDGSAVTADLRRCAAGTAPGSGTSMLSSTFNLKSTANTPVRKIRGDGLATAEGNRIISSGQMLCLDLSGTLTALAGMNVCVFLKQLRPGSNR
jgi:hypothetical protein